MTAGIVSARGRDIGAGPYDDYMQIDAPINKGNSGGPAWVASVDKPVGKVQAKDDLRRAATTTPSLPRRSQ